MDSVGLPRGMYDSGQALHLGNADESCVLDRSAGFDEACTDDSED